jgi:hypothetical protein
MHRRTRKNRRSGITEQTPNMFSLILLLWRGQNEGAISGKSTPNKIRPRKALSAEAPTLLYIILKGSQQHHLTTFISS